MRRKDESEESFRSRRKEEGKDESAVVKRSSSSQSTGSNASVASSKSAASKRSDSPHPGSKSKADAKKKGSSSRSGSQEKTSGKADGERTSDGRNKKGKDKTPASAMSKNIFSELPKLADAPEDEKEELARKKCQMCAKIYDFYKDDQLADKEGKRQTLFELVEYINSKELQPGEQLMQDSINMVAANLFRALIIKERSPLDIVDPEDDDPYLDPAWPHLEIVYEFLLRYVMCQGLDVKVAAKSLNEAFVTKMLWLLDSDDARERDYAKMITQRIYSKFISLRTPIRRAVQNACLKVTYETEMSNGVGELLQIMQNIINGFKVPLKAEHLEVLFKVLIPLHKVRSLPFFHQSLMGCMIQYVQKESRLISDIISALLNLWPNAMATKQVLFLDEIEDLMNAKKSLDFLKMQAFLVRRLALCMTSPHSQVAERALGFWKNDHMSKLFNLNRKTVYPIAVKALYKNVKVHWHGSVHGRTFEVLRMMVETDHELFDECSAESRKVALEEETKEEKRLQKWKKLEEMFAKKGGAEAAAREGEENRIATMPNGYKCTVLCRRGVVPLKSKGKYGFGVSWQPGKALAELQLQTLAVNDNGTVMDATHDYKAKILQGAIYTSMAVPSVEELMPNYIGDGPFNETAGGASSSRAAVNGQHSPKATAKSRQRNSVMQNSRPPGITWVHLARIPQHVRLVVFVVASYHRGHVRDASSTLIRVVDDLDQKFVAQFNAATSSATSNSDVGVVAVLRRCGSCWNLMRMDEFAKTGRHFMDVIEPTLGSVIRSLVPNMPKRQKVQLPMQQQGSITIMPSALTTKWLFVGVGWDLSSQAAEGADLEVGCVLINNDFSEVTVVSSPDTQEKVGVRHGGNGLLSAGMTFDLESIPQTVEQIVIAACTTSEQQTMSVVQNPHCRVIDRGATELARVDVKERSHRRGLIMSRLFREPGKKRWSFQAICSFCDIASLQTLAEDYRPMLELDAKGMQAKFEIDFQSSAEELRSSRRMKRNIVSL